MFKKSIIWLILLLISGFFVFSQEIEFSATAPSVVAKGEQFRLSFSLNARPQEFTPPSLDKFYILAGPSTSSSSSVEIINGKMTQTYSYTYTYILEATTEGQFTIDPATVIINKKEHSSNPLTIEVVKGTTSSTGNQQQSGQQDAQQPSGGSGDDMYVTIELDKTSIYRGQAVLATIKLYTRNNIAGFEEIKFPSFTGFWNQEVETPNNVTFQRVNVDGKIYNMGVLKKYLLFPQRGGEIEIEPFELVILYQQRASRSQSIFDDFFGAYQTVRKRLVSKKLTLKVKNLPTNAPPTFTGAVGRYSLDAKLDKQTLKTNEAVNLQVRVSGSGNIRLIETPKILFPAGFETFDPKVNDNINATSQGASGSKTFDYVAIPRTPGDFDLGQVEFTYFDPVQEKYITLKSKPMALKVEADGSQPANVQVVGFGKEDVRFIGKDIRFIKTDTSQISKSHLILFGSKLFFAIYLIMILGFALIYYLIDRNKKFTANIALVRTRKANRVARKRLREANRFLAEANNEFFHNELLKAMWGYVSDKLSIPLASLSSETVKETLFNHDVTTSDVDEFIQIISTCEYARYAPRGEASQMADLFQKALDLISKLESVIKK